MTSFRRVLWCSDYQARTGCVRRLETAMVEVTVAQLVCGGGGGAAGGDMRPRCTSSTCPTRLIFYCEFAGVSAYSRRNNEPVTIFLKADTN